MNGVSGIARARIGSYYLNIEYGQYCISIEHVFHYERLLSMGRLAKSALHMFEPS
jgi:hypothetical protein